MEATTTPMVFGLTLEGLLGRGLMLAVAIVVASVVCHLLVRVARRALDQSNLPSASIFVNLLRTVVWAFALLSVLEPVFGIKPTAMMAALGVTSLVITFGMQDTVSNVVAGLGLMAGRVVQPGDAVEISGFAGVVTDVNWRSTTVRDRNGCEQVIPNAVLNKTALTRLTPTSSTLVDLVMAVRADADPREVERFLLEACTSELGDTLVAGQPACVAFTGSDAYGVECHVYMHVRPDAGAAGARDVVMRRVMGQPWLACA